MPITALTTLMAFITHAVDTNAVAPQAEAPALPVAPALPQTTKTLADIIFWATATILCAFLAEAALAAGACAITQTLMDLFSTNWLANVYFAVGTSITVALILILADITLAVVWLTRRFRRASELNETSHPA
jgi:hypothetical protein